MPPDKFYRSDQELADAVEAERNRCIAIVMAAAERQDNKHKKSGGWYVDDGDQLRDIADEIKRGVTYP